MQSFQYSLPNSIDNLTRLVISDKFVCFRINQKLKKNPDWLFDNYEDNLSEENLYELIKTYRHKVGQGIILYFVDYADENAISNRVFNSLYEIKQKQFYESLIVVLSHKKLNEYMLLRLCDTEKSFEAFFELAILYYTDDSFEPCVFGAFLKQFLNSKFSYMSNELFSELSVKKTLSNDKQMILQTYKGMTGDGSVS